MLNREQIEFLFPKAVNAAVRAGAVILELYEKESRDRNIVIKKDFSPLTEADGRAHQTIREYLSVTHVPLLSEEGREMLYEERKDWDLFWMVDPLDGTKEFIKGNGEFTVNIALMVDNKPVLSVVYVPYIEKIYFAEINSGAFVKYGVTADPGADHTLEEIMTSARRLPLHTRANSPLRVAVSRSHNTVETYRHIQQIRTVMPDLEVIEQGSSYKFCLLAEGTVDYYIRTTSTYEWDTAAGELILSLAGGKVISLPDKKPFAYNKKRLENPHFVCASAHCPDIKLQTAAADHQDS